MISVSAAELAARLLAPRTGAIEPDPVDLHAYFSDAEITRGARFARPQLGLLLGRGAVQIAILVALALRPPERSSDRLANPVLDGAAGGAAMSLVVSLAPLPLAAVARRRAIAVGLLTQSWRAWSVDLMKANAIQSALAASAGGAAVAITRRYPQHWWAPGAAGAVLLGAALAALSPVLLDPLFNDFTPLAEGDIRSDVLELARNAGVKVGEVYAVDASRRTTAANAYVTGLGPTKRVVLFDTLLNRYSRDEVRVVVAHELAHVRGRDVPRGVLFSAIVAPAAALAVQRLSWRLSTRGGGAAALPALTLAAGIVSMPIGLIANRLSRALERRADAYSLELTGATEAFVSFERRIALQNVADLEPPRWVTRILATHPSTAERIGAARAFARYRGAGA